MSYIGEGPGLATRVLYTYTSLASQATFSGNDDLGIFLGYSVGLLNVYVNGVLLSPTDYTATNGTSVVMDTALALNDIVTIEAYGAFSPADTFTIAQAESASNLTTGTLPVDRLDLLGTVSETAGVPTGAIIERGSNANGEYVKFADGTMICTKVVTGLGPISTAWGGLYRSDPVTSIGSYAATFIAAPVNAMFNASASGLSFCAGDVAPTTTTFSTAYLLRGATSSGTDFVIYATAIGRWW